jgi:hypothetical protein
MSLFIIILYEPKYRANMLTRESTRGPGTPPVVKGLVWFTDGSRMKEGTGAGVYGQYVGRRLSISLGKYAALFQTAIYLYAILACAHDIQINARPEKPRNQRLIKMTKYNLVH